MKVKVIPEFLKEKAIIDQLGRYKMEVGNDHTTLFSLVFGTILVLVKSSISKWFGYILIIEPLSVKIISFIS